MELLVHNPLDVQCRDDNGQRVISGYAAVYFDGSAGTQHEMWPEGPFERIMPGAFDQVLKQRSLDVVALFNHDVFSGSPIILGRTSNGTLSLRSDAKGLHYEVRPPDTSAARDLMTLIARKDVRGSSIGFTPAPKGQRLRMDQGRQAIEITKVGYIRDLGPVTMPAYKAATTQVRSQWQQIQRQLSNRFDPSIRARAVAVSAKQKGILK